MIAWSLLSISQNSECNPLYFEGVRRFKTAMRHQTHQFVQHNEQPDSRKIYRIPVPGDDQLTHALGFKARPTSTSVNSVRRGATGERKRTIDNSNVGRCLRSNLVKHATDIRLESRFR